MTKQEALFKYLLQLGDNAVIHGHRLSEWCSRGPLLEEDLALTNIALDHLGRAQSFLKYAAAVEGNGRTDDDLAFKRGERQFYNHLLTELPIGDFAFTIAKQFMLACYDVNFFAELVHSSDTQIASIAAKSLKESRYHLAHAHDWCLRLGRGTAISNHKLQNAFNQLWMYSGELFEMYEVEAILAHQKIAVDLNQVKLYWTKAIDEMLIAANLTKPNVDYMQSGSRKGIHTEFLGHLLSEMQYLPRAYPDATW